MKLLSVRVQNYKCIDDSEVFNIDQMTCLVGKNESGKTALLEALYTLNPVEEEQAKFDVLEFPRNRWDGQESTEPVLTTEWSIDDEDRDALRPLFANCINGLVRVTIKKGYDNRQIWTLNISEEAVVKHYVSVAGLFDEELSQIRNITTIAGVLSAIAAIGDPGARLTQLQSTLASSFPNGKMLQVAINLLSSRLPKFVYFSEYYTLPGRVSVDELTRAIKAQKELEPSDHVFQALLDLAGIELTDLQEARTLETLIAKLEAVSNRISRQIFEYWTQNQHLEVEIRCDAGRPDDPAPFNSGYIVQTRIKNRRHGSTVNFDERSRGFVWFFSFLIWFSQMQDNYGDNLVILLDEPGLSLHARAQADLLRYMREKLCPEFQVIYTTHSPFMVDPENLLGVRTVEDVTIGDRILGTKVGDKSLSTDADTVFPLQAALGYDITQTLFVGKHTLLVEGPSDLLYLKWMSNELKIRKRTGLDPRWIVSPCGGIAKISSFLTLFGSHLHVAILADFHESEKKKVRDIRESELMRAGHVLTAEVYAEQTEADLEDMFSRDVYINLVNQCYGLKGKQKIPTKMPSGAGIRVVKEVEDHFRTVAVDAPEFDHFLPSAYAIENAAVLRETLPGFDIALERFERLFVDLNQLLNGIPTDYRSHNLALSKR